ncbi:LysR family transcriptional regulator [Methylobacterium sp. J-090]|uniref:LysR family transcriptional regulator n=1 Tax=Methylobacterium sp. J-090 TaxID=2836666 RepID=UPI001FB94718|nr:LysR family transcriptional regulator [Methylobacterium sp. J-090]MCJ2083361.1 LysR family transcriptional regulator [Methylobacterium sp. J-090]
MDRLDAMAVFVAVVEAGSLAAAGRRLGHSPATVTRAVAMLEERLGERLLHRSTRALRLTERGEHQASVYRSILAELADADGGDADTRITGRIVLTAPELFGRAILMPVLETFLDEHAGVSVRVILLNRLVSLVEEGVDVAVRLGPLPASGFIAVRLGEMRRLVCAAPGYLARAGMPSKPGTLHQHQCIGTEEGTEREQWHFIDRASDRHRPFSTAIRPRMALNSAGAAIDAALRGHGICRVMAYQVVEHIEAGRLLPLLRSFEPAPLPIHLIFHPIPRRNAALRAFVDHATPRLRAAVAAVSDSAARSAGAGSTVRSGAGASDTASG